MINFLENDCQNLILSPVLHDQHTETHSLDSWLTFNTIGALSGDDTPQSPQGLCVQLFVTLMLNNVKVIMIPLKVKWINIKL